MLLVFLFLVTVIRGHANVEQFYADFPDLSLHTLETDRRGSIKFVRFNVNNNLNTQTKRIAQDDSDESLVQAAAEFLRQYHGAFGLDASVQVVSNKQKRGGTSSNHALHVNQIRRLSPGSNVVIFDEIESGVPVFGGGIRVHFSKRTNALLAVSSSILTYQPAALVNILDGSTNTTQHDCGADAATTAAMTYMHQHYNATNNVVVVEEAKLTIYDPEKKRQGQGPAVLCYHLIMTAGQATRRVFVLASTGQVIDELALSNNAINRVVKDWITFDTNLGSQWNEGDAFPTGTSNIDNTILGTGEIYNLVASLTNGAYLSIDGADRILVSNLNAVSGCPNAFYSGNEIHFCVNTVCDDVVAHEWMHGYTEYLSGLIYFDQSGALNEAYSDIFGETVDYLNGREGDIGNGQVPRTGCSVASSDWFVCAEACSGWSSHIRDLLFPNCKNDAAKVSDTYYWCSSSDHYGVHSNSGVINHLYAMLVHGQTFNGYTINSIGTSKALHLFWWTHYNYVQVYTYFREFADYLQTTCDELVASGEGLYDVTVAGSASWGSVGPTMTAADCAVVADAIAAVELRGSSRCSEGVCSTTPSCAINCEDWVTNLGIYGPGTYVLFDQVVSDTNDIEVTQLLVFSSYTSGATCRMAIYADNGSDEPIGSPLATSSSFSCNSWAGYKTNLQSSVMMLAGQRYWAALLFTTTSYAYFNAQPQVSGPARGILYRSLASFALPAMSSGQTSSNNLIYDMFNVMACIVPPSPSPSPSASPSAAPSASPSGVPSASPSASPSGAPSASPSAVVLPSDIDGDGYSPPEDCNDYDPTINPGLVEECNGRDDNCNLLVDEIPDCNTPTKPDISILRNRICFNGVKGNPTFTIDGDLSDWPSNCAGGSNNIYCGLMHEFTENRDNVPDPNAVPTKMYFSHTANSFVFALQVNGTSPSFQFIRLCVGGMSREAPHIGAPCGTISDFVISFRRPNPQSQGIRYVCGLQADGANSRCGSVYSTQLESYIDTAKIAILDNTIEAEIQLSGDYWNAIQIYEGEWDKSPFTVRAFFDNGLVEADPVSEITFFPLGCQAGVEGLVWLDSNGNGLQDDGATVQGLPGVHVHLVDANNPSITSLATTDETGMYRFPFVADGTYRVEVSRDGPFPVTGSPWTFSSQSADNDIMGQDVDVGYSASFVVNRDSHVVHAAMYP